MRTITDDVRQAVRLLFRSPGFTATSLLMLALGIGANTAIFSIIDAVLLRPLPFREAGQLVRVTLDLRGRGVRDVGMDAPQLFDYAQQADVFATVSGLYPINVNLTGASEPERLEGQLVSATYFELLGATARLGRVFDRRDYRPGISEIAVISDGLWKRRFGADPGIIGRQVRLDNDLYTIIGVMPPGFRHPGRGLQGDPDMWAPAGYRALPFRGAQRGNLNLAGVLARLRPGVSIARAQAQVDAHVASLVRDHPDAYPARLGWAGRVIPLQDDLAGTARPALLLLAASVVMVLIIACANVANLLLARGSARRRELAIRLALGASGGRILRQLLIESTLLSIAAGLLGFALASWSLAALIALAPADAPRMADAAVDLRVLAFSLLVSVATGVLFGIVPARHAARTDPHDVLKDASRGATVGGQVHRLRHALVIAEFALALVLLIGASLLIRSFATLYAIDPGFDPTHVTTARLWMPQPNEPSTGPYFTHAMRLPFFTQSLTRLAALPGVEAAGWTSRLPFDGITRAIAFMIEGRPLQSAEGAGSEMVAATGGYFEALRIPLIRGRVFTDRDTPDAPGVVIVNERFAQRYFPSEDPIGRRLRPGGPKSTAPWLTIVGIVGNTRSSSLDAELAPQMYRCALQNSSLAMALVVRTHDRFGDAGDAGAEALLSREVRAVDPDLPLHAVKPLATLMANVTAQRRFAMVLLGTFAATALMLAAAGIYAVMAYLVRLRTREIGIRMALGARPSDALTLVLARGLWLTLTAAAIGIAGALALAHAMQTMLFGVSPFDPVSFAGPSLTLTIVALLACYIPARRASRIDPVRTLNAE